MRRLFALLTLPLCLAAPVQAEQIYAAGGAFDDGLQERITCRFFNGSASPIQLINPQIYDQFGTAFAQVIDECGPNLGAFDICGIAVDNGEARAWSCRVRVNPDNAEFRGTLILEDATGHTIQVLQLQQ